MAHSFEDMVKTIQTTTSAFALSGDLPIFRDGLADLLHRLQKLEGLVAFINAPPVPGKPV